MQKMSSAKQREEREEVSRPAPAAPEAGLHGLYREMKGYPVTIRLLDPPLHEFLPKREDLMVEIAQLELTGGESSVLEERSGSWPASKNCTSSIRCSAYAAAPLGHYDAGDHPHAGARHHRSGLRVGEGRRDVRNPRSARRDGIEMKAQKDSSARWRPRP
ncbi:MAG: hypothetical protein U0361_02070 [Nitrospiraceae bacterium]